MRVVSTRRERGWRAILGATLLMLSYGLFLYPPTTHTGDAGRCQPPIAALVQNAAAARLEFTDVTCPKLTQPRLFGAFALLGVGLISTVANRLAIKETRLLLGLMVAIGLALIAGGSRSSWASEDSKCGSIWESGSVRGLCGASRTSSLLEVVSGATTVGASCALARSCRRDAESNERSQGTRLS